MKRKLFGLIAVLFGLVVGGLALEAFATAWITLKEGKYVSARELYDRSPNSFMHAVTRETGCVNVDMFLPHPYLGWVHHGDKPCGRPLTNNVGLYGEDFPTTKRTDRYVVLLTGGSVAANLGRATVEAPRYLEVALERRYVSPNGQPFLVLNGGEGGWKQPQQFILFSIYATRVDAVVTLDGYNEAGFFRPDQGYGFETPAASFLAVNPLFRGSFGDAVWGWLVARAAQAIATFPVLDRSQAAWMVHRALLDWARRWDILQYDRTTRMDTIFALPDGTAHNPDKIFTTQLERWQSYDLAMAAVADEFGVKSAFFLQPLPVWGKTLTEEEKQRVGDMRLFTRYREIVAGMMALRERGLAVFDLGDVYKDEKGSIYVDEVHPGPGRAYEMIAERMADDLAQAWGLKRRP